MSLVKSPEHLQAARAISTGRDVLLRPQAVATLRSCAYTCERGQYPRSPGQSGQGAEASIYERREVHQTFWFSSVFLNQLIQR